MSADLSCNLAHRHFFIRMSSIVRLSRKSSSVWAMSVLLAFQQDRGFVATQFRMCPATSKLSRKVYYVNYRAFGLMVARFIIASRLVSPPQWNEAPVTTPLLHNRLVEPRFGNPRMIQHDALKAIANILSNTVH